MLKIPEALHASIGHHGALAYPHECCGAMLGCATPEGKTVTRLESLENADTEAADRRFLVTDRDYVRLERLAAELGLDLLGFYHSHPDHPSRPSRTDLEHAFPWFSYVIVAIERGVPSTLTSWVLEEDRSAFRAEAIERTAGPSGPEPTAEGASPCHES